MFVPPIMERKILTSYPFGCAALAPCGRIHICVHQLFFVFDRNEMSSFIEFLSRIRSDMDSIHGYNKVFFETGLSQMKIALNQTEVNELLDVMNEASLALSLGDILEGK